MRDLQKRTKEKRIRETNVVAVQENVGLAEYSAWVIVMTN